MNGNVWKWKAVLIEAPRNKQRGMRSLNTFRISNALAVRSILIQRFLRIENQ